MPAPRNNRRFVTYCSVLLLCSSNASTAGENDASSEGPLDIASAQSYVDNLQESLDLPGLAVAVAIHGEIVWSYGTGFANIDHQIPVTPETIFRIGSVSKVLTAGGAARLYAQGRLNLDANVNTYVPEFPDKGYTRASS